MYDGLFCCVLCAFLALLIWRIAFFAAHYLAAFFFSYFCLLQICYLVAGLMFGWVELNYVGYVNCFIVMLSDWYYITVLIILHCFVAILFADSCTFVYFMQFCGILDLIFVDAVRFSTRWFEFEMNL